ncbi:MAG: hypothetical protein AAB971_02740 [Patescibacteria group bacterium]
MNPKDTSATPPDTNPQPSVTQADAAPAQPIMPPSPTVFSYNETQAHNRTKHKKRLILAAIVLMFVAAGSSSLWTTNSEPSTLSKSQTPTTTVIQSDTTQATQQEDQTPQPTASSTSELDQHEAYPQEVREAFIKQCVSYNNKESTCTCNINFIQQRYTLEQYTAINQNPESRQYEEMVAAAYDNNDCT